MLTISTTSAFVQEKFAEKNCIFYDIMQKGLWVANSKHDFFPKLNYDKRVGARIISQKIKTMSNSLLNEKHFVVYDYL